MFIILFLIPLDELLFCLNREVILHFNHCDEVLKPLNEVISLGDPDINHENERQNMNVDEPNRFDKVFLLRQVWYRLHIGTEEGLHYFLFEREIERGWVSLTEEVLTMYDGNSIHFPKTQNYGSKFSWNAKLKTNSVWSVYFGEKDFNSPSHWQSQIGSILIWGYM